MSKRKLTDDQVRQIREDCEKYSDRRVAVIHGLHPETVLAIACGHSYKDVPNIPRPPVRPRFYGTLQPRYGK